MVPGNAIKIFISYAHKDEALREKLNTHLRSLEREGLIKPWHDRDITAGSEWAEEIDQNLDSADVILLLISADFIDSRYCYDLEMARAIERHEADEARVIPIILRACDWTGSPFGRLNALPTGGRPVTSWDNEDEAFTDVARGIRRAIADLTGVPILPNAGQSRGSSEPIRIPQNLPRSGVVTFVGREQKLQDLHTQLQSGSRLAITAIAGMGGIGKTELALQYAIAQFQSGHYPSGICWLRARGQEIATQITNFAQENLRLTLPETEIDGQIRHCWQYWPEGEVLIVIDDVTDYGVIAPYLPPSDPRFKLLITTRLNLGRSVEKFAIEELDEGSALAMLEGIVEDGCIQAQLAEAKALCQWVGYLPLGLELLGRYLADDLDLSVQALLAELEETRLEAEALQAVEAGMTANLGVIQALELSWRELSETEQDLACLLGMFAVAPIPWALVEKCFAEIDGKKLKQARKNGLLRRNLLKRVDANLYQLHQIVQEFFREKLRRRADQGSATKASFCNALVEVAKSIEQNLTVEQADEVKESIVHLEELGRKWLDSLSDDDLMLPFIGVGRFYRDQGIYDLALPRFLACLEQTRNRFGAVHLAVVTSLINVALLYRKQGKYEAAERLYVKALEMSKELSDEAGPSMVTILNNLALVYLHQGKYEEVEPRYLEALEMSKQLFGEANPTVATNLNNLAEFYREMGKYELAEPHYLEALAMRQQVLGKTHPEVATSLNNLALLYHDQKKYELAEPRYLEALAMRQQLLGQVHPFVATTLNNLAALYSNQGRDEEAEPLFLKALAMRKQLLGQVHPSVATTLHNLAGLYRGQGRYEEAEPLYIEALAIRKRSFGKAHPKVADTQGNFGELYQRQGDYRQAESLYLEALATAQSKFGSEHPLTKGIQSCLDSLPQSS